MFCSVCCCSILFYVPQIVATGWSAVDRRGCLVFFLNLLWVVFLPSVFVFVRYYAATLGIEISSHAFVMSGEQFVQMLVLVLVLLGLVVPSFAVFRFVALNCPEVWRRYLLQQPRPDPAWRKETERESNRPSTQPCPHCGSHQVGKVRGLHGWREGIVFGVLFLCGLLPEILYYAWQEAVPYCSGCRRRVRSSAVKRT